ncbi:MAG: aldehyde dehydrogenase family protein [Gemmatimonadetes bacterium]|nr:aldehyde dehydrogenase family protein [Gemmatimonadota bacterium]
MTSRPLPATADVAADALVREAVARARGAQLGWDLLGVDARAQILERFRQALYARRDEVATLISRENGKPAVEATMTEVATALDFARYYGRIAADVLAPRRLTSATLALWRKRITITYAPHGVVAVISPWNYPFMLPAGIVTPALLAGNAVLLKPSELTPACGALLAELMHSAGVPTDVLQVLQGDGTVGAALVQSDIDKVFFTGSVSTGRRVGHACAERFIPCALELGGSDPAIVCEDADVEHAASGITLGRFSNGGQTCVAPSACTSRRLCTTVSWRRCSSACRRCSSRAPGAASFDVGPLIQPSQAPTLAAQGTRRWRAGRAAWRASGEPRGHLPPTLLLDVPPGARALCEETFGPLLPIVRVRDDAEAIALANATPFGLSASVWSRNRARARAIAAQLQAGTVVINDVTLVAGIAEVPHGGMKASGAGRAHGAMGLEECVRTRTVVDDLFTSWRQAWWFGYGADSAARGDAYVRLAHGPSILARLSGAGAPSAWGCLPSVQHSPSSVSSTGWCARAA